MTPAPQLRGKQHKIGRRPSGRRPHLFFDRHGRPGEPPPFPFRQHPARCDCPPEWHEYLEFMPRL